MSLRLFKLVNDKDKKKIKMKCCNVEHVARTRVTCTTGVDFLYLEKRIEGSVK